MQSGGATIPSVTSTCRAVRLGVWRLSDASINHRAPLAYDYIFLTLLESYAKAHDGTGPAHIRRLKPAVTNGDAPPAHSRTAFSLMAINGATTEPGQPGSVFVYNP